MITGKKALPFVVVYGETKQMLGSTFANSRQGESILFGKNRLLEIMDQKDAVGFEVKYVKSSTDAYDGIQVMMVAVDKYGVPLLDIPAATIDDDEISHGGIWGVGHPNQPEPSYLWICCIDWSYILLLIRQELLNAEMLTPDEGCPDCGPWDDGLWP